MNVAMYLRKSRADENNPLETLERHKEILLSYAKDNNLTVIDIFEEVISGGMLYNRTEMLKLLDAIPSHIYDAVLCIDLDRLGRGSAADSEKIFDVLKENAVMADLAGLVVVVDCLVEVLDALEAVVPAGADARTVEHGRELFADDLVDE